MNGVHSLLFFFLFRLFQIEVFCIKRVLGDGAVAAVIVVVNAAVDRFECDAMRCVTNVCVCRYVCLCVCVCATPNKTK